MSPCQGNARSTLKKLKHAKKNGESDEESCRAYLNNDIHAAKVVCANLQNVKRIPT